MGTMYSAFYSRFSNGIRTLQFSTVSASVKKLKLVSHLAVKTPRNYIEFNTVAEGILAVQFASFKNSRGPVRIKIANVSLIKCKILTSSPPLLMDSSVFGTNERQI